LLLGILLPVLTMLAVNTAVLYRQALAAADTAYDRSLLASAKTIGELLEVSLDGGTPHVTGNLLYSALEAFEADNRSRIFYKVSGFGGEMVSGFADLPAARPAGNTTSVYAALVHFYDDQYLGQAVRMAVLLQPVAGVEGQGVATIQVAETLELRRTLASQLLVGTLSREALLLLLIAAVVVFVVHRATQPVRDLSQRLQGRDQADLSPLAVQGVPLELQPIVAATNTVMQRLAQLLDHQKRFVRDASHQLRTPLAVLKTQVQSAQRGDVDAAQALIEIGVTVQRATELANQMLALAKVEQLRQQGPPPLLEWAGIVRAVALDLSALIGERRLDFELHTETVFVRGFEWALRELTRNLLHNAVKFSKAGGSLQMSLRRDGKQAHLCLADSGPGLTEGQQALLFQPFVSDASASAGGSGLGLAICHDIVLQLGGRIQLDNRVRDGAVVGLTAQVWLPLATPA
jgi:two-component system, OmpR family, sensor histidine kinase TctE